MTDSAFPDHALSIVVPEGTILIQCHGEYGKEGRVGEHFLQDLVYPSFRMGVNGRGLPAQLLSICGFGARYEDSEKNY